MIRKKLINICFIALFLFPFISEVNGQAFKEKDFVLHGGVGLGSTYSLGVFGGFGLPVGVGAEYGIADLEKGVIGVGGEFGYVSYSGFSISLIGARGSYHFAELLDMEKDNLDLYGGLGLYYRSFNFNGAAFATSGMLVSFHAGARYYFTEKFGAYGEIGNNWAWLNLGVVLKLN
ncbi:hypothetical protein [Pleomorphovibrio marinus]|uniref:hypothetical protein n=1 Tax=Pleomorphovibrio marinus TaxID=2164132 RepID=UPI000E0B8FDA|nr:hypothetical protein [Pleomorphovibrio marinus]